MDDFKFWYTVILMVLLTVCLVREIIQAEIAALSVLILLLLGGVIDANEAFAGFSNHGMLTIGFLFIVAGALLRTGVISSFGNTLMGKNGKVPHKLFRLLLPVTASSAFFNNTLIVTVLIPTLNAWAKKHHMPVSKFLIPLSYASILGGMCTLIGTSTNLVVHGLMLDKGLPGLSFFELSKVGIPAAIVGLTVIITLSHKFLPDRKDPIIQLGEHYREFVVVLKVEKDYQFIGKSIERAGLRHLKGLFLFQIERRGRIKTPVGPEEEIRQNDFLFFTGIPETILEFQYVRGLSLVKDKTLNLKKNDTENSRAFEAVISPNSPLIGKRVKDSNFRSSYNAVIIAIHRSGERIREKIGDIVLHTGDTLLLLATQDFVQKWYNSKDFYLVSKSISIPLKSRWQSRLSIAVFLAMVVTMISGLLPVVVAACTASTVLILSRCLTPHSAFSSVNWRVLLIIATALGIAKGLDNSGVAQYVAERMITTFGTLGPIGLLAGIYIITNLFTEIITNIAAAALTFPITFTIAQQCALDPSPFFIAVAIAASASFSSPIGYQTNLMVYGPGGYKFTDYLRVGLPLNFLVGATAISLIYWIYF